MNKNCGICRMPLQTGGAWIARCKDAMVNPRGITCPVGSKLHICNNCSGESAAPTRHSTELWKTPSNPSMRLKQFAMHRVGGTTTAACTLQITPYIINKEFTVSFGADSGRVYGIPENLVPNGKPDFPKIWTFLKGDKLVPKYTDFTVGSGGTPLMANPGDKVFTQAEGTSGLALFGGCAHFHVGLASHGGKGTTERVWYNLTGTTIKFSNVLNN